MVIAVSEVYERLQRIEESHAGSLRVGKLGCPATKVNDKLSGNQKSTLYCLATEVRQ